MVSERQRLARKRFKEAHPELFPNPEPNTSSNNNKNKNLRSLKGRIVKRQKSGIGKHPLRTPGMRPGESCFICKSTDHLAKQCPQKSEWEKHKICLLCRKRGHSLKNCPEKGDDAEKKFCYNCGDVGHSLSKCPKPIEDGGTKFAKCFICNEQGHISKSCPKNTHGVYPKGGSCIICGGVTHLAKDCPDKGKKGSDSSTGLEEISRDITNILRSGDDIEDDFIVEEELRSKKKKASPAPLPELPSLDEVEKKSGTKSKKKPGPKIVNFK